MFQCGQCTHDIQDWFEKKGRIVPEEVCEYDISSYPKAVSCLQFEQKDYLCYSCSNRNITASESACVKRCASFPCADTCDDYIFNNP